MANERAPSPLDRAPTAQTLAALRSLVRASETPSSTLDPSGVARLASQLPPGVGVTLDLEATRDLGAAVVVLWPASAPWMAALSPREREVAALVAQGLRNRDIARRLFISEGTVKDHVHHILSKAGLRSRAELAARASSPTP